MPGGYSKTEEVLRNVEPRDMEAVPVRDGREFIQGARPHAGAERAPTGHLRRTVGVDRLKGE